MGILCMKASPVPQLGYYGHGRSYERGFSLGRKLDTYDRSPWAHLAFFLCAMVEGYEQYISARVDRLEFLSHLVGKTIVCDCELHGATCQAQVLKEVAHNLFETVGDPKAANECCAEGLGHALLGDVP